jgi:hypothetical protein
MVSHEALWPTWYFAVEKKYTADRSLGLRFKSGVYGIEKKRKRQGLSLKEYTYDVYQTS